MQMHICTDIYHLVFEHKQILQNNYLTLQHLLIKETPKNFNIK